MQETTVLFLKYLRKKRLQMTPQREVILNVFLGAKGHLSIDDLTRLVKEKDSSIGATTVFRTLKIFVESGLAREVDFGDKRKRYEHKYKHKHHDHLICIQCGTCIEAFDPKIEKLQKALCEKYDFEMKDHKLEIFGLCKNCRK